MRAVRLDEMLPPFTIAQHKIINVCGQSQVREQEQVWILMMMMMMMILYSTVLLRDFPPRDHFPDCSSRLSSHRTPDVCAVLSMCLMMMTMTTMMMMIQCMDSHTPTHTQKQKQLWWIPSPRFPRPSRDAEVPTASWCSISPTFVPACPNLEKDLLL